VLNTVYAYKKNLRLRVSAAQSSSRADTAIGTPVEQQSYLIGAKKYWTGRMWTDAGASVYLIDARNASAVAASVFEDDGIRQPAETMNDEARYSRMHGLNLNLGLQPLPGSRVDLRYESHRTTRSFVSATSYSQGYSVSRVAYTQDLANCMHVRAGFTAGSDAGQLELRMSQGSWSVQAWQDLGSSGAPSLQIAYSKTLGGAASRDAGCSRQPHRQQFEPMIDAAARRPEQFINEPLSLASP
jgi:hypothetical protein